MVFGLNGKFTLRRRQELASYTPARAGRESLEAAVGSYKPIMQKEEVTMPLQLAKPQRPSLPDVLPERLWSGRLPPDSPAPQHQSPPPHTTVSLSFALDYKSQEPQAVEPKATIPEPKTAEAVPEATASTVTAVESPARLEEAAAVEVAGEPAPVPPPPDVPSTPQVRRVPISPRRRLAAEVQSNRMRQDFIARLPSDHLLNTALTLPKDFKTASDYITGLFHIESTNTKVQDNIGDLVTAKMVDNVDISKEKEEQRARIMPSAPWDMKSEKVRLSQCLERELDDLRVHEGKLRSSLDQEEKKVSRLMERLPTITANKVKVHAAEVGQVTALIAALASRLARTQNAISSVRNDPQDKEIISKRDKLLEQLDEAKLLKENIDRRATTLSALLSSELQEEDMNEYKDYIGSKTKLLLDIRDLQDTVEIERQRLIILNETVCKR